MPIVFFIRMRRDLNEDQVPVLEFDTQLWSKICNQSKKSVGQHSYPYSSSSDSTPWQTATDCG